MHSKNIRLNCADRKAAKQLSRFAQEDIFLTLSTSATTLLYRKARAKASCCASNGKRIDQAARPGGNTALTALVAYGNWSGSLQIFAPPKTAVPVLLKPDNSIPMANSEILLLKPVDGLGGEGDQVKVRAGYARNFLLPKKFAVPVTQANRKHVDALKKRRAERETHELTGAQELGKKLEKVSIAFAVKTGEGGKMFG